MIETERLLLRPFTAEDAADLLEYLHKPTVNCFACMQLENLAAAQAAAAERAQESAYYFAITLKESGKVIGEIFAHPETSQPDGAENMAQDTFSPCWMLNSAYCGQGYAYEAAHAYFDYLFTQQGARRIYAYTEDYNLPSQKLCRKLCMRQEGFFREFVSFITGPDGNPLYENTLQFAILRKEWQNANHWENTYEKTL
jgi:RimJ/RimL family protein N-acetyltransferase